MNTYLSTSCVLLFGLLLIQITGCKDNLPTEPQGAVIMPLAKGNMWIGNLTTFAEDGSVISTVPDTIKVIATTTIDGSTWYQCRRVGGPDTTFTWYQNREDGLWEQEEVADPAPGENPHCLHLHARFPAHQGDSSATTTTKVLLPASDHQGDPEIVDQVIARYVHTTDTAVQVAQDKLGAYLYYTRMWGSNNAKFTSDMPWQYFVPNVGPVKIEWYAGGTPESGRMTKVWKLTEKRLH